LSAFYRSTKILIFYSPQALSMIFIVSALVFSVMSM